MVVWPTASVEVEARGCGLEGMLWALKLRGLLLGAAAALAPPDVCGAVQGERRRREDHQRWGKEILHQSEG